MGNLSLCVEDSSSSFLLFAAVWVCAKTPVDGLFLSWHDRLAERSGNVVAALEMLEKRLAEDMFDFMKECRCLCLLLHQREQSWQEL